jgi:hypothetical protein
MSHTPPAFDRHRRQLAQWARRFMNLPHTGSEHEYPKLNLLQRIQDPTGGGLSVPETRFGTFNSYCSIHQTNV